MKYVDEHINYLLKEKKSIEEQLNEMHFKGYPEIKELNGKKYIYLRYKKYDRLSSQYAGIYSESLFNELKELSKNVRELNSKLRKINTELASNGVNVGQFSKDVLLNLDFVRQNMNVIIYGQAIVEGVSATFLDTEEVLEKGSSSHVNFDDTLTILNLKNAWEYILDEDTIRKGATFSNLSTIAGFVNDRQVSYPDQIRTTNVTIGGCSYKPPLPNKEEVIKNITSIIENKSINNIQKAIEVNCYIAKAQIFNNGNKRTALLFANLFLIINGEGFLSIPYNLEREYKMLLVGYYDSKNEDVKAFLLNQCYNPLH